MNNINFTILNKVALVTGGASGIGYSIVKEFLKKDIKGVTIVDINVNQGEKILMEIQEEFGKNKVVFVKCDVSNIDELKSAFEKCVKTFESLDIVVNNAGILDECDVQRCISTNLIGVINGINLALNTYLPKYKTSNDAIILNTASVVAFSVVGSLPIYAATKAAIVSLTRSWGCQSIYEKTQIRVVAICPGYTLTPVISSLQNGLHPTLGSIIDKEIARKLARQTPEQCAQGALRIIQNAPSGTLWIVDGGENPYEYKFLPIEIYKPQTK